MFRQKSSESIKIALALFANNVRICLTTIWSYRCPNTRHCPSNRYRIGQHQFCPIVYFPTQKFKTVCQFVFYIIIICCVLHITRVSTYVFVQINSKERPFELQPSIVTKSYIHRACFYLSFRVLYSIFLVFNKQYYSGKCRQKKNREVHRADVSRNNESYIYIYISRTYWPLFYGGSTTPQSNQLCKIVGQ